MVDHMSDAAQAAVDNLMLMQARYVLKNLHVERPGCGYDKLAAACEAASQPSPAATVETLPSDVVRAQLREGNRKAKEVAVARSSAGNRGEK